MRRVLGILSWVGMAAVVAALAARVLNWAGTITISTMVDRYISYAAIAGAALVFVYVLGQLDFRHRHTRQGTVTTVSIVVMVGILIAVNYLSNRRNTRWDLTANKQYSLSEQTIKILSGLTTPVKFVVFDQATNIDRFRTRLDQYTYESPQVSVEYHDADREPVLTKQYKIDTYGTIVIEYMGRSERVTSDSEQDLTNGLIKVVTGAQKKVYFTQGHGEKDTDQSERTGYSSISAALGRDNYGVDKLVLAQQQDVPADASVVILAGPRTDLLPGEGDMLKKYLARGGHVMILLDPPDQDPVPTPVLDGLLKDWAIAAGNDIVVDASGVGQLLGTDASVPVAAKYSTHPITNGFGVLTAYPLARSISPIPGGATGRTPQTIIETSPRSWAETNIRELRSSGKVELNENAGDKPGPVSIAVAESAPATDVPAPAAEAKPAADTAKPAADEAPKPESRLVVIGDSDFAANSALGIQGNRDIFMNAVNWLAQQENLVAIRPREPSDRRLTMTAGQSSVVRLVSVFLVPIAVFGIGILSWWRRR